MKYLVFYAGVSDSANEQSERCSSQPAVSHCRYGQIDEQGVRNCLLPGDKQQQRVSRQEEQKLVKKETLLY